MYTLLVSYVVTVICLIALIIVLWGFAYLKFQTPLCHTLVDWPLVTVIIPAYNEEKVIATTLGYLQKAIANYPGQVEVVMIDDGSLDSTVSLVQKGFPWVKVVSDGTNQGKAKRVLQGIQLAERDLFMVLDADIILPEQTFQLLVHTIVSNPSVSTIQPAIQQIANNQTTRLLGNLFGQYWEPLIRKSQAGMGVLSLWGCGCSMAKTDDLKRALALSSKSRLFQIGADDQATALSGIIPLGMAMLYQPNVVVFHPQAATPKAFFQQTRRHRGNRTAKLMALASLLSVKPYFAISMLVLEVLFLITVRPVIEIVALMLRCKRSWRPVNSRWSS
jgi:hypothetical protein